MVQKELALAWHGPQLARRETLLVGKCLQLLLEKLSEPMEGPPRLQKGPPRAQKGPLMSEEGLPLA